MRADWQQKPLIDVCLKITDGSHYSPKISGSGYHYITVRDIKNENGLIDFDNCKFIAKSDYEDLVKNGCKPELGDVLFSKDGTVGKVSLVNYKKDFVVLSSLAIIRPNIKIIDPTYLRYVLRAPFFLREAIGKKTGAAIRRIVLKNLKTISIPFTLLSEQKRIVAILDEAFAGIDSTIANTEKNLVNAHELFESYLNSALTQKDLGAKNKSLEEVVEKDCSLSYGIVQPGKDYEGGSPVVRPTDLTTKVIKIDNLKRINTDLAKSYSRTILKGNDLLLCVRGSTGVVSVASEELRGANVTRGIVPIRFNPLEIDQEFGYYLLNSNYVQKQIREKTYGAALMQINIRDLKKIDIHFPELDKQKDLVEKLSALNNDTNRLETMYQQKLDSLNELKQSLLQKAFSGELTAEGDKLMGEAVA